MATIFTQTIRVDMADGRELTAIIDQRDHAAYEGSEVYDEAESRNATKLRFLAWNALKRVKQTAHSWPEFNTEACISCVYMGSSADAEDAEDEESENPPQG